MASCTADFLGYSAQVGDTIHADFTWTDAVLNQVPFLHTAVMSIKDPSGNDHVSHTVLSETGGWPLECVADETGVWTAYIQVWDGTTYVTCTDTITVSAAAVTSCTASFQESSSQVGQTIHADFTWADAELNQSPYLHYALLNIKDPNGSDCDTYIALNPDGSYQLSCVTGQSGTWTCNIMVWDGTSYVICSDSLFVSPSGPVTGEIIYFDVTPNPVPMGDDANAYITARNTSATTEYFALGIETPEHGIEYSDWISVAPDNTLNWNRWLYNITYSQYCTGTLWYWDGSASHLLDTEPVYIYVETICEGNIDNATSTWSPGPFEAGTTGNPIAVVHLYTPSQNTGTCQITLKFYTWEPSNPGWYHRNTYTFNIAPNSTAPPFLYENNSWQIPNDPLGYFYCAAVAYGETETEPTIPNP